MFYMCLCSGINPKLFIVYIPAFKSLWVKGTFIETLGLLVWRFADFSTLAKFCSLAETPSEKYFVWACFFISCSPTGPKKHSCSSVGVSHPALFFDCMTVLNDNFAVLPFGPIAGMNVSNLSGSF